MQNEFGIEMPDIQIGDVVFLKSGGPAMTVEEVVTRPDSHAAVIHCAWIDGGQLVRERFGVRSLTKSSGPPVFTQRSGSSIVDALWQIARAGGGQ